MQPKKYGQGNNRRKSAVDVGKDSAGSVLRPFGPANAVYILSRRIYEHFEVVINAGMTMRAIFQRCLKN